MTAVQSIFVRALKVRKSSEGIYEIQIPAQELNETQLEVLQELFPNLGERVHAILAQEAILASILDTNEVPAEPPPDMKAKAKHINPVAMPQADDSDFGDYAS